MKFLLVAINAKYIHSNPGIYSLRSYAGGDLQKHIELAEYTINNRMEEILSDLYTRKPDAIGFSCYIWNFSLVQQLTREVHKLMPGVPIWYGGPEVSFEFDRVFAENPEITGIMVGEGEATFKELLEAEVSLYEKEHGLIKEGIKKGFREASAELRIKGTATREGFHGCREMLALDEIPFYYADLSEQEEIYNKHRIIYFESSRGCPYRCSYCLSSIDKKVRLASLPRVKEQLQFFLDRKIPQVKFIDRTFNCNKQHAMEIWRYIKENDNGITNFHFEIAAELLDEEQLEIISDMRPGLIQLEIGVQTANPVTLKEIHRSPSLFKIKENVAKVHSFGNIHQHLDLIVGLPYEDMESFRHSFDEVYRMRPQQLQLGFLKVLKGSEIFRRAQEYGIVYQSMPPYEVLYTKWIRYEDVQILKQVEEMVELFYNSNQFTCTLAALEKMFTSPFAMFEQMALYFRQKGYFVNSPARAVRYQILLDFVKSRQVGEEKEDEFAQRLTFDIYLRENAKSRPGFAADLSGDWGEMTAFYKKEAEQPALLSHYVERGYDARQMQRMTHMEVFSYPVWEGCALQEMCEDARKRAEVISSEGRYYVLFDYEKRSPLTHEATYYVI